MLMRIYTPLPGLSGLSPAGRVEFHTEELVLTITEWLKGIGLLSGKPGPNPNLEVKGQKALPSGSLPPTTVASAVN